MEVGAARRPAYPQMIAIAGLFLELRRIRHVQFNSGPLCVDKSKNSLEVWFWVKSIDVAFMDLAISLKRGKFR
jgi:hypothetical protein